jgi:pyrimidine operon attenuation protein / uracil phosphoribosyltransferase
LKRKNNAMQIVLTKEQIDQKITRISHQIIENSFNEQTIILVGICGNGLQIAHKILKKLSENTTQNLKLFEVTVNKENPIEHPIEINTTTSVLKNEFIVLIDDVLNSGKTMQYALLKLLEHPVKAIRTVALVDRRHRRYPIKCDFVGITLSTTLKDRVEVDFEQKDYFAYLK